MNRWSKIIRICIFLTKIRNTGISRIPASIATSKQGKNITRKEKKKIFRVYQLRNESLGYPKFYDNYCTDRARSNKESSKPRENTYTENKKDF